MVRGEIWWVEHGDKPRPALVLTRDPVADVIDALVVALCTTAPRGLESEVPIGERDGMPASGVVSFDNIRMVRRTRFLSLITKLSEPKMDEMCRAMNTALGC